MAGCDLPTRLDTYITRCGCDHLPEASAVTVCGRPATSLDRLVFPEEMAQVRVSGELMPNLNLASRVFALDMPRGMEVDLSRTGVKNGGLRMVFDNMERHAGDGGGGGAVKRRRLMHVGRLDKATSGLLLVTDDVDLLSTVLTPGKVDTRARTQYAHAPRVHAHTEHTPHARPTRLPSGTRREYGAGTPANRQICSSSGCWRG